MEKISGDMIKFDSRLELDEVLQAIDIAVKAKPELKHNETLKKLSDFLDVMYMEW